MSLLPDRTYHILPKDSSLDGDALGIGPVPLIYPPPDVPVRLIGVSLRERWLLKPSDDGTYTVWAGRGQSNDYKWIVKDNTLFVSSVSPPKNFRFESAGEKLYAIGLPNENLLLTLDREAFPPLTFKPADGSDAQRFQVVPIERD